MTLYDKDRFSGDEIDDTSADSVAVLGWLMIPLEIGRIKFVQDACLWFVRPSIAIRDFAIRSETNLKFLPQNKFLSRPSDEECMA